MWRDLTLSEMVVQVLARQAQTLVEQTEQPFEDALVAILKTDTGRQLEELVSGPHRHQKARDWLESLIREGTEQNHAWWLEDYLGWLRDEEARAEHRAFLEQALAPRKGWINEPMF